MPIITISRGAFSRGESFAEALGENLGYQVLSREVIVAAAEEYGVSEAELQDGMKQPPGFWNRLTHKKQRYLLAVQATLAWMVREGRAIYHGHAGQLLLKGAPHVIKLRLIAPMEFRVRCATIEFGCPRAEALKQVTTADERRRRWVRKIYNVEWSDPGLYDLVVNLGSITLEAAAEMVAGLARRREEKVTADERRSLFDFALEARVRAELLFHSDFSEEEVRLRVQGGEVHLSGAYARRNRPGLAAFIRGIEGVAGMHFEEQGELDGERPGEERKVRDLMVHLTGYPHVAEGASIRDAMVALSASSVKLADGHEIHPRYVLVLDREQRLVGILGRRDLLRGVSPGLRHLEEARRSVEHLIPMADDGGMGFRWLTFFSDAAIRCAEEPVSGVMRTVRGAVRGHDDLSVAVATMIQHGIDLVPVVEQGRAVGVVLMTDVFDTVAEHVLERGTPAC